MRNVKAMYRRGNILARTISGFGCRRTFFLTHLISKFLLGLCPEEDRVHLLASNRIALKQAMKSLGKIHVTAWLLGLAGAALFTGLLIRQGIRPSLGCLCHGGMDDSGNRCVPFDPNFSRCECLASSLPQIRSSTHSSTVLDALDW